MRHRVGVGLVCTLLFTVSATAGVYSQCRRLCRPEIVRCRAAGFPRATCRRVLRADCIARGAALCPFVLPATTTVPPSPTTTLPVPTTPGPTPVSSSAPTAASTVRPRTAAPTPVPTPRPTPVPTKTPCTGPYCY